MIGVRGVMTKQKWGALFVVSSAAAMIINLVYFKSGDYYDVIRILSYAVFIIGSLMIPTYAKAEKKTDS